MSLRWGAVRRNPAETFAKGGDCDAHFGGVQFNASPLLSYRKASHWNTVFHHRLTG